VTLQLPSRYESLSRLGKGGGGEVWAVRDRYTGERRALKVLSADATESEMAALVREAVTLSGLEGLGVPRVLQFGRLPGDGRPFMVRELVEGQSLQELIDEGAAPARCLVALASAAEQVTLLHRAGLLHGDIKPANVIVEDGGRATLVDLGLAAPWRDAGTTAQGLTPKYAAPELLRGKPLTVRAEVYALGMSLTDIVAGGRAELEPAVRKELESVAARATRTEPGDRYPSADELASALRRASPSGSPNHSVATAEVWPIVGIEATASRLVQAVHELPEGGVLVLRGAPGSGRSVLLRRLGWSLGVEGRPLAWIDASLAESAARRAELAAHRSLRGVTILVDDSERLDAAFGEELAAAARKGAILVVVGAGKLSAGGIPFDVPPLGSHAATELVHRAVPSLTDRLVKRVVELCGGRPGELRRFVRRIAENAVASEQDLDDLLGDIGSPRSVLPLDPLERAVSLLDRGRYTDARVALGQVAGGSELAAAVAWARLELGLGETREALDRLLAAAPLAQANSETPLAKTWQLYLGRARYGVGDYGASLALLAPLSDEPGALGAEALAYRGLALGYSGEEQQARAVLAEAVARASTAGARRIEAIAEACFGAILQRGDDIEAARGAYERAIAAAEDAGDAGVLATTLLNLASLLRVRGDIGGAIERYEAAVDMGRRSGRRASVRQALLNLANADLYLGRLSRARASIETLGAQRDQLPRVGQAQLLGLEAELADRAGQTEAAVRAYAACAAAFHELGLGTDAAEVRLEGVLVSARTERPDLQALSAVIAVAEGELSGAIAHRSLLCLARASVAWVGGDEKGARSELEQALAAAREANQREWIWRALEARSEIEEASGQPVSARRDREEALAVLEQIAAKLPRDLREVFWNDPRRNKLRSVLAHTLGSAAAHPADDLLPLKFDLTSPTSSSIAAMTSTPLERRLARILEINSELLGEMNVERLAARVTDHAVDMVQAERGFVLLRDASGMLTVHTSRGRLGDAPHAEFSRSIAEQVVKSGEPVVAMNAKGDSRLRGFASVHQLSLESVACVPIQSRSGDAIGALYVETRLRRGATFERELPTLRAFADQVAIALETAALVRENVERAAALAEANKKLEIAQGELKELLGDRTAQLKRARARLRDARDTLYGHFGYQGLVGTSAAMRRVYALIDRVKATDIPVLITGESGTGKEVAARAIHRASARADKPFHGLNCAAVPEHLLESELFGHVRGAFTGADRERKGLFREADTGTLLLDEIGEMPQKMQTGLLRVLQDRMVRPVGGAHEQEVDVRLIFATHRDLGAMVKEGKFREDLFYRIHVVEVHLPPLRERAEDVAPLVDHFLGIFAARYKREKRSVSRDALRRLTQYSWPGNVRQLEHVLLNAWVLSDEAVIGPEDLDIPDGRSFAPSDSEHFDQTDDDDPEGEKGNGGVEARQVRPSSESRSSSSHRSTPKETLSRHRRDERERIISALEACNWNRVQAAKLSGIPRRTFYRRLREYGIQ
jgi:serine/threonine-protein kinase PknK